MTAMAEAVRLVRRQGTVFAPRGDGASRPRLAFKREQDVHQLTSTQEWKELAA